MNDQATESLFSYGTLQTEAVQLATFGRRLIGKPEKLAGYRLMMIHIQDPEFVAQSGTAHHRNLEFTGMASDLVEGTVFRVSKSELEKADQYEPEGYERVLVQMCSGERAWVFLNTRQLHSSEDENRKGTG